MTYVLYLTSSIFYWDDSDPSQKPIKSYRMNSISVPNVNSRTRFQLSHQDLVEEEDNEFESGLQLKIPQSSLNKDEN